MDFKFVVRFVTDICKVWWWRLMGNPIVVVTTESGGLGDYLWIRSYYQVIKKHYNGKRCRIIVAGMKHWTCFALDLDGDAIDIYREFESCDNPRKSEKLFFALFKADVFFNFRAITQKQLVRCNTKVFGEGCARTKTFYREINDKTFLQWKILPTCFEHRIPLLPIRSNSFFSDDQQYVVLVEKGNTQGGFNDEQLKSMADTILNKGLGIFYNGNYAHFLSMIDPKYHPLILDGYTFPLGEYGSIVNQSISVITVNTFIYHIAVQLNKPCVVVSVNEYASVDLTKENQTIVFNKALAEAYQHNALADFLPVDGNSIASISPTLLVESISNYLPC